jgi:hypothetical protein
LLGVDLERDPKAVALEATTDSSYAFCMCGRVGITAFLKNTTNEKKRKKSKTAQWSNSRRIALISASSSRKISRQQQQTAFAEGALPETPFPPQIALSKAASSD